ncbi:peptidoglycan DD-metalloendopeptidase family protein [Altererythrobacter sp. ZODW24]|uniref:murein hydrolase activator EnvC family protein n=1 Tax=Altererythrobacter sp. ZODW24 TaxID=2185142 RepID=UPI000DF7AAFF|nr:peptidoglycan DD-metalloendopeptidase family protein [Altererythrobacter sp. ZODW24]
MKPRRSFLFAALPVLAALALGIWQVEGSAQRGSVYSDAAETRAELQRALSEAKAAQTRADKLDAVAESATKAAEKTASEAAALAARVQQAEAGIAAAQARISLIDSQRQALTVRLSRRQQPLVRLTGALQKLSRRPLALSALRPGSVRDMVYLRAMLATTVPQVAERTSALRGEIDRGRQLEREAVQAVTVLRESETTLTSQRTKLAALETRQRLESRRASGSADREAERALALAEQARDLDGLVGQLDKAGELREELAQLSGPVLRPSRPETAAVVTPEPSPSQTARAGAPSPYQLPVAGRTLVGFGSPVEGGVTAKGVTLAPVAGAQVVAPAAGRVAFAGTYRGYGRIVIIEHNGVWTSLVTGLARTDVSVGEELVAGAPLGVAEPGRPEVILELRRDGTPVNPLEFTR